MTGETYKAAVLYGTDHFGSLFTTEERGELEAHTEAPLITFASDRIIVAFDRSDHVYEFPVMRNDPPTDEATWGRQFADWLAQNPRPMESL